MSQAGMAGGTSGGGSRIITTLTTFAPNATLQEFDDFIEPLNGDQFTTTKLNWISSALYGLAGTTDHPGIGSLDGTGGLSPQYLYLRQQNISGTDVAAIALGGGITSANWNLKMTALSTGANSFTMSIGMADSASIDPGAGGAGAFIDGVYFQYNHAVNGGNWVIKCTNTSVTTSVNTAIAADTNFHTFSIIVNSGATSVSFYIDGSLVGSAITTNIPAAVITPMVYVKMNLGSPTPKYIDLFWITINLTNARAGLPPSSTILGTGMLIEQYRQTAISTQILNTDAIVGVSSTAAPRTLTMPASSLVTGQRWTFKDESGGAAANNITINGNGKNIDGAATYVINTNFGAIDVYYNGSQFYII